MEGKVIKRIGVDARLRGRIWWVLFVGFVACKFLSILLYGRRMNKMVAGWLS